MSGGIQKNKTGKVHLPSYRRSDIVIMPTFYCPPETFQAKHIPPCPTILAGMKWPIKQPSNVGYAACEFALQADGKEIQLTPVGHFRAKDGRPHEVSSGWYIDAEVAKRVINRIQSREDQNVIDYEHQTLFSKDNGQPAPAAGWYSAANLEWREGMGLVAAKVDWTPNAQKAIDQKEYRYLSPVIMYNKQTGEVLDILMAAVTNFAAIDGMADLAAAHFDFSLNTHKEDHPVNEILLAILKALGVIEDDAKIDTVKLEDIKQDDVIATLTGLQESQTSLATLRTELGLKDDDNITTAIATLKAKQSGKPDPTKYVAMGVVEELQKEVAALKTNQINGEGQQLVDQAVKEGKLATPAKLDHAKLLIESGDIATLKSFIGAEVAIEALKGSQTGGKGPAGNNEEGLSDQQLELCKNNGIDPQDYKKTLDEEAAAQAIA